MDWLKMLTRGRGGLNPKNQADVICERPLNVKSSLSFRSVAATEKSEGSDDVAWLVEAPEAEIKSFHTRSEPYLGPRI